MKLANPVRRKRAVPALKLNRTSGTQSIRKQPLFILSETGTAHAGDRQPTLLRCAQLNSVSPFLAIFAQQVNLFRPDAVSARILPGLIVTVVFGVFGYLLRGVTPFGALAGTFAGFVIYISLGWGGFVTLIVVFVVTLLCTRVGRVRKQQLGLAESSRGRNAAQVLANVAAAAVFAALSLRQNWFAVASVAAMAEAAADTSQSEIGEIAASRAWLITNFRAVPPGTDGGVTLPGLLAGAIAASVVASAARYTHVISPAFAGVAAVSGFLATTVDSLLGATLERRGWLNNNGVNFVSTIGAGAIAAAILRLWPQ
jgi:uncharacterized protein (TIGR00297 family)